MFIEFGVIIQCFTDAFFFAVRLDFLNVFKAFLNVFGNDAGRIVGVLEVFELEFAGQVNE